MSKTQKSPKKVVTIFLDANGVDTEFYFCSRCRIPVIKYNGRVIMEVPGRPPYTPYTIYKCKGSFRRNDGEFEECGRHYCFISSVLTQNPEM